MSFNLNYLLNVSPKYLFAAALVPLALSAAQNDSLRECQEESQAISSKLELKDMYPERFSQLKSALSSSTEESRLGVIQQIRTFANQHIENTDSYNLMEAIHLNHIPLWERIEDVEFCRTIANTPDHPNQIDALGVLWFCGNPTDNKFAYYSLQDLSEEEGRKGDEAALTLYLGSSGYEVKNRARQRILPLVRNLRPDVTFENANSFEQDLMCFLSHCDSDNHDDINFIRSLMAETQHPLYLDCLMWLGSNRNAEDKTSANDTLLRFYNDNPNHPKTLDVAIHLTNYGTDEQKDQTRIFLRDALGKNLDDKESYEILNALFFSFKSAEGQAEIAHFRDPIFARIAQNRDPVKLWLAANCALFLYGDDSSKENQLIGRAALRQIAECRSTATTCWSIYHALTSMRTKFRKSVELPYSEQYFGYVQLPEFVEDKAFATSKLHEIAENPYHVASQQAIITLAMSVEESEKPYLQSLLRSVIENPNKPGSESNTYCALSRLLDIGDEPSKEFAHAELTKIADTEDHPYAKDIKEKFERSSQWEETLKQSEALPRSSNELLAKGNTWNGPLDFIAGVGWAIVNKDDAAASQLTEFSIVPQDKWVLFLTDKDGVVTSSGTIADLRGLREKDEIIS
jgi:hypothetical protein